VLLSGKTLESHGGGASVTARDFAVTGGIVVAAVNGLAGLFGLWSWYRAHASREFWVGVRIAQGLAIAYAALAGLLLVAGHHPHQGLYWLYALLPIAIGFVAEQLRLVAADQVLTMRDIEDAQEIARLSEPEQQEIVVAILRREMVVMALAAVVVCFLALRAAGTW
jgi:hypothetical protein